MFQPHTIVINTKYLFVMRHDGCDYHCGAPFKVRINPFRYAITLRRGWPRMGEKRLTINKDGRAWLHISNAIYRCKMALSESKGRKS